MSRQVQTCPDPIRASEAARILGVTVRTITRRARAGLLVVYRDEHTTLRFYSRAEVLKLLPTAQPDGDQ